MNIVMSTHAKKARDCLLFFSFFFKGNRPLRDLLLGQKMVFNINLMSLLTC